ncbi:hypothetical protein GGR58DRAFT_458352 [Xylaria digitata]|nr:hypothetical protein GGR58DRAFT_458352 [Xylaria digitata]
MRLASILKERIRESHSLPRLRRLQAPQRPTYPCLAEPPGSYDYREFVAPLKAVLSDNQKILQIGAMRAGAIAFGLAVASGLSTHVTAVTGPGETADDAKAMAQQLEIPSTRVTFVDVPDLRKLPFEDNYFDVVYACNVMAHLPPSNNNSNVIRLLREMKRVTKPSCVIASRDLAAQHFFPNCDIEPLFTNTIFRATGLRA